MHHQTARRTFKVCCFLFLGVLSTGCVHLTATQVDVHGPLPPPPSESLRAELGSLWVSSSLAEPNVQFVVTPAAGAMSGLGRGAGGGAMIGCGLLGWPAMMGNPIGIVGCAGGAVVGAISGGIYGAVAAEPEKAVQTVMSIVRDSLTSPETQQRLRDLVIDEIHRRTTIRLANELDSATVQLETGVLGIQLDGLHTSMYTSTAINPEVRLVVTAQARLIGSPKQEELYTARFQYWGPKMTVPEWGANDAQPMREERDRAMRTLAEQIVDGIFYLHRP